jgi:hypothetical protein
LPRNEERGTARPDRSRREIGGREKPTRGGDRGAGAIESGAAGGEGGERRASGEDGAVVATAANPTAAARASIKNHFVGKDVSSTP